MQKLAGYFQPVHFPSDIYLTFTCCDVFVGLLQGESVPEIRTAASILSISFILQCIEAAVLEGECGPCPVFTLYPGIGLTNKEKSQRNVRVASQHWFKS